MIEQPSPLSTESIQVGPSLVRLTESSSSARAVQQCSGYNAEMAHTVLYVCSSGGCTLVNQIWKRFGKAKVDVFANAKLTHFGLWFSQAEMDSLLKPTPCLKIYDTPFLLYHWYHFSITEDLAFYHCFCYSGQNTLVTYSPSCCPKCIEILPCMYLGRWCVHLAA